MLNLNAINFNRNFDSIADNLTKRIKSGNTDVTKTTTTNQIKKAKPANFLSNLQMISNVSTPSPPPLNKEYFQGKMHEIQTKGTALKKYFNPKVASDYMQSVQSFLNELRSTNHYGDLNPDGMLNKINIIDEELEQFAYEFDKNQAHELKLAQSLNLIEGMLIDIIA